MDRARIAQEVLTPAAYRPLFLQEVPVARGRSQKSLGSQRRQIRIVRKRPPLRLPSNDRFSYSRPQSCRSRNHLSSRLFHRASGVPGADKQLTTRLLTVRETNNTSL